LSSHKYFFNAGDFNKAFNAIVLSPYISFHLLKQPATNPINFQVFISYLNYKYSSDYLEKLNWRMNGSGYGIGGCIYNFFNISANIILAPFISVDHSNIKTLIRNKNHQSIYSGEIVTSVSCGLSFEYCYRTN